MEEPSSYIKYVIINDISSIEELNTLKKKGALIIKVDASETVRAERGLLSTNYPVENVLKLFNNWSIIIKNNSTLSNLYKTLNKIIKVLILK